MVAAPLEMDSAMDFETDSFPVLAEDPLPASDLLRFLSHDVAAFGKSSPELIAPDPFEYETACQPLAPSHRAGVAETYSFPQGEPAAIRSYLLPQPSAGTKNAAPASEERDQELELCHPKSRQAAAGMGAASKVAFPPTVALKAVRAATETESSFQVLEMEPATVRSVSLDVPLQSDIILELLDQQVPHPDQLYALGQFAAYSQALVLVGQPPRGFDAPSKRLLPARTGSVVAPGYRLSAATSLLRLPATVMPANADAVSLGANSEIFLTVSTDPKAAVFATVAPSAFQVGTAGLQSLGSDLLRPMQRGFTLQKTGAVALDLSTGVSSDVTFPTFASGASAAVSPRLTDLLPLTFVKKRKADREASRVEPIARLLPQAVEIHPILPQSGLTPMDQKPPEDALRISETLLGSWINIDGLKKLEPAWAHATGFWHHAPRDLKILLFAIPMLLALFFHPGLPPIAFAAPRAGDAIAGSSFTRAISNQWGNVRQTLENRAAVALDEDFRSGLDNWASPGGSTTEWSFDSTGFVRPGPLALYRPSVNLTDYQIQFLGTIDKKALSWVVRAADFENFYVVKLEVLKSGPIPAIGLTRYAVIQGKSRDRHDVSIPLSARTDTLYKVRMDVQGSNFTVEVQDQIADSWTETRLPRGGIGFFTASGEASRLRWVQITHQYDMLGRLCAYLAPYDTTNGSWQP